MLFATISTPIAAVTVVLLLAFSAARAAIGFFPMDAPESEASPTGRLHNVLATTAFATVTAGAFTGAGALHDGGFVDASAWSTSCGIVMAIGTVGMLVTTRIPSMRTMFGLAERLIYLGFLAWFVVLCMVAVAQGER